MSDEATFQAALDADPADHAARALFADWLRERGDWRAAGYRWMAECGKHAGLAHTSSRWRFWCPFGAAGNQFADADVISESLFDRIVVPREHPDDGYTFPTRQAAEEALCRALAGKTCGPGQSAPGRANAGLATGTVDVLRRGRS